MFRGLLETKSSSLQAGVFSCDRTRVRGLTFYTFCGIIRENECKMSIVVEKVCPHCKIPKEATVENFYWGKARNNWLSVCKECEKIRSQERKAIRNPPDFSKKHKCSRCKRELSARQFYLHPGNKRGLSSRCIECIKTASKSHNRDLMRQKERIENWRLKNSNKSPEYVQNRKLEVLSHYSGDALQCNCCGETEDKFLCLDHIDGAKNFTQDAPRSGHALYKWLKKNDYPEGFQVLCFNCNLAKSMFGRCPHLDY
jgi:hypothetical protein